MMPKRSKYGNVKKVVDGITFHSKREADRWLELKLLVRGGKISNLRRQVAYEILPSVKFDGNKARTRACVYYADFTYDENGAEIIEDVKGVITEAFRIKRHALKALCGLEIRIVK